LPLEPRPRRPGEKGKKRGEVQEEGEVRPVDTCAEGEGFGALRKGKGGDKVGAPERKGDASDRRRQEGSLSISGESLDRRSKKEKKKRESKSSGKKTRKENKAEQKHINATRSKKERETHCKRIRGKRDKCHNRR